MANALTDGRMSRVGMLERGAVPAGQRRADLVRAAVEVQDQLIGVRGVTYALIGKNELGQLRVEVGCVRLDRFRPATRRLGVGVRHEGWFREALIARPEAGQCLLLLCAERHPAGWPLARRRRSTRIARGRQIE